MNKRVNMLTCIGGIRSPFKNIQKLFDGMFRPGVVSFTIFDDIILFHVFLVR